MRGAIRREQHLLRCDNHKVGGKLRTAAGRDYLKCLPNRTKRKRRMSELLGVELLLGTENT